MLIQRATNGAFSFKSHEKKSLEIAIEISVCAFACNELVIKLRGTGLSIA